MPVTGFFRLLFSANPSSLDVVLLVVGTVTSVAGGMAYPFFGLLFGKLIDDLNSSTCGSGDPDAIHRGVRTKVLLIIAVSVIHFIVIYTYMGCWSLFGERLVRRLRTRYLSALLRQETAFFDALPPGEVSSRLDQDLQTIQTGTSEKVGIFILSVSYFVGAYCVSFMLDARLALCMCSLVPAYLLMGWGGSRFTNKYTTIVNEKVAAATSIASECLSNIKVVQAFGAERRLEAIFSGSLLQMQGAATGNFFTAALELGVLYFIAHCANSLAIWQGSREIAETVSGAGTVTVGQIYTVILILVDASFVITRVSPYIQMFSAAAVASEQLFSTIDRPSLIDGTALHEGIIPDHIEGEVEFRNVDFTYPSRPNQQILNSLSLRLPAGKMTAVVGRSGSGKSTIASLLSRLYDIDGGQVLLDGTDIRNLSVRWLRSQVAVVEQNPTLLDQSILENIAYGLVSVEDGRLQYLQDAILDGTLAQAVESAREGKTLDEAVSSHAALKEILRLVRQAADRAGARYFVEDLEHGFASRAGHKGRQLSGGQAQRIAIARALIRQAPILVLDEATAALDSASERAIQQCLEKHCKHMTIICIAHRLSTIKQADRILVMQEGRLVEQGKYADLTAQDGTFASMVRLQDLDPSETLPKAVEKARGSLSSPSKTKIHHRKNIARTDGENAGSDFGDETTPLLRSPRSGQSPDRSTTDGSFAATFGRVLTLARPERIYIIFGVLAAMVLGADQPANAIIFGNMIGGLSPCQDVSNILASGSLFARFFFMLAVVEITAATARGSFFGLVSEKVLLRTRILTFRSLLYQDVNWHESEGRTPNTLLSYLTTDSQALSGMTGTVLGVSFSIIVSLGAGIILSHIIAWKISIVLLSTVPLLLLSGFLRLRMLAVFHERHQEAFAHSVAVAKDAVDAARTVAIFSLEQQSVRTYERVLREPYDATLRSIAIGNFWLALSYAMSNLIYALAYWWGAKLVASGQYTQTQFFIVLPALLISAQSCGQFFSLAPDMSRAGVAARRILAQMDIGPEDQSITYNKSENIDEESTVATSRRYSPEAGGVTVTFEKVRFSYPSRPNVQVLHGLSMQMPANKFMALTGTSGSGKSTIFSLIERFYLPSSGAVILDGQNIGFLDETQFRDDIALVPQENILFDETVRFNIALGARHGEEVSQAEIEHVSRLANIHDVISALPQGYETRCGSGGALLSGGQRQRLAIARALIRKPRLLLLDESTSALDAESERLWQTTLDNIISAGNITVVAIAHRLSTIVKADTIFLIEKGQCVDYGTHEELFQRSASYKSNVLHQALS